MHLLASAWLSSFARSTKRNHDFGELPGGFRLPPASQSREQFLCQPRVHRRKDRLSTDHSKVRNRKPRVSRGTPGHRISRGSSCSTSRILVSFFHPIGAP